MTELLTAAQMRAIEEAAIASGEVTGLELMERAGRGVVEAIWEEWPELRAVSGRAVVLCGPGNNGGDGFVVARLLKEWGWEVEVFLYGDPAKLPPDARVNYERWGEMGEALNWDQPRIEEVFQEGQRDTQYVLIDALFGIGLSRALSSELTGVCWETQQERMRDVERSHPHWTRVVAVDVPSGLCADSGQPLTRAPKQLGLQWMLADLTVTFHAHKIGHYLERGSQNCTKVAMKDIGLSRWFHSSEKPLRLVGGPSTSPLRKQAESHKFRNGSTLIVSGGVAGGGAARLAARGALRIGAGVVTVGAPPSALMENASALDAIMVRRVEDGAALAAMLEADDRINALCLGPGMGTGAREVGLLEAALAVRDEHAPYVCLDADALTLLSEDVALFGLLHDRCVLTPHAGEFARLFPDLAELLAEPATKGPAYSKVDATREAAARAGCVVLFKGPDTVIAAPDGRCSINAAVYDRAAPWLATAGSGDVLAGFITGLMARGFAPMQAAETGAWLHVECARSFGPGLIAEDLPEELPKVFRALGL